MGILHIETLSHVSTDRKVVGTALLVNTRQRASGADQAFSRAPQPVATPCHWPSRSPRKSCAILNAQLQSLFMYVKQHFLGLWHSGSRPVDAVRETTFPARLRAALSLRGAASQLHRREVRARKRHDLSIAPYVKLHFTEDPLVMDLIVCRNSAGVGCGDALPGNHGSGRDARFAPDCATRSAASGASADDADPMTRASRQSRTPGSRSTP